MTPVENVLSLRALSKRYREVVALDRIDLDVRRGEFITLLGPSGSGKTTTLMLIAGFEAPTGGEIFIDGVSMAGVPPHRRRIGVVFQNYALFPHLDVFENVAFGLRNLGWNRARINERADELLDLVGLKGLERRLPSQLSGGQQQRVAIARALSFKPNLLLLDEPLGALDKKLRERMLVELRRIHRTLGVTMLYVSHDQEEALAMSDRIAVMDQGRIVQVGRPRELYEAPNSRFVAEFVGETNVLEGVGKGGQAVDVGGWTVLVPDSVRPGDAIALVVRPEKIVLGSGPQGWNVGWGCVDDVLYLGASTRYRIRTRTSAIVTVLVSNGGGALPSPGEETEFSWDPGDGLCLPVEVAGARSP